MRPGLITSAFAALFVALALALGACSEDSSPEPVTEQAARDVLDRAVAMASAGALRDGCEEIGAPTVTCNRDLRQFGETPPADHTVVVLGASIFKESESTMPGVVLELCISARNVQPFRSDFLVQRDPGGGLVVPYPVYWSGVKIIASNSPHLVRPSVRENC